MADRSLHKSTSIIDSRCFWQQGSLFFFPNFSLIYFGIYSFFQFTSNFYKYFNNKDDIDETTNAAITTFLKSLEKSIAEHGGSFVLGSEVSSVDLLIWPWFERLMVFKDIMPGKLLIIINNLINQWFAFVRCGKIVHSREIPCFVGVDLHHAGGGGC